MQGAVKTQPETEAKTEAAAAGGQGQGRCFVSHSLKGRRWTLRSCNDRITQALAQSLDLEDSIARILAGRGLNCETAASFLTPRLREQMPDPSSFLDMDTAAARTATALENEEKITIFGDYDVDGATSSALLKRYLRSAGCEAEVYIPDRLEEGYGPNPTAMKKIAERGTKLCITVDCGTTATEALQAAHESGMDVIILDHHVAELALPPAVAIVNPNRLDETSPHTSLAAVGVTFLFCVALNRELRRRNFFS